MPYEYLDNLATADVAFRAWESSCEKTFVAAVEALLSVMVEKYSLIEPVVEHSIVIEDDSLDMLLFQLLNEIIFLKDTKQTLFKIQEIGIQSTEEKYILQAQAVGEKLDPQKHKFLVDVKAVTLYHFKLEQMKDGWQATVVLDV